MNIVNKLTLRQLRLNKKRTLVTIMGTIISAAMITAVATLGLSFMDIMQRQQIAQFGEWHVKYSNVNKQQLESIQSNSNVEKTIMSREPGYAYLKGSQNKNKPYVYLMEYNKEGFEKLPIKLSKGRFPAKADEIVLNEEVIKSAEVNYSIGDKIELDVGHRESTAKDNKNEVKEPILQNYSLIWENNVVAEKLTGNMKKTYTIVGFINRPVWEYNWSPGYTGISYIDKNIVNAEDTFNVSVIFTKVDNKLFDVGDKIASENGIDDYEYNNGLLRYYGVLKDDQVKNMLYTLSAIIMIIIMIGSISLIYNAFAISVSERSRYLGMLSSVGATKKQKRNSVFFEGAVIGAISIPLGIMAGYMGLGITYFFINPLLTGVLKVGEGFRLTVYPSSLIIAILVSAATILISTYIPARRASNISAIDAIRQVSDVKIKGHQVKTSKITRLLFGIEGDLGLKNLKRNKGRYKATVFSLIISMVLFLVVSSFTMYLRKSLVMTQEGINFDIQASVYSDSVTERENILQSIYSVDNIKDMATVKVLSANTLIPKDKTADYIKENKNIKPEDGKFRYVVKINVLDEKTLKTYAKAVGIDFDKLIDTNKPSAIVIDTMQFKDESADKYVEKKIFNTKIGEQMHLQYSKEGNVKEDTLPPIYVAALTNQMPMGVMTLGDIAGFHIIMSQASFDKIIQGKEDEVSKLLNTKVYYNSDKPIKLQENLEKVQGQVGESNLYIFNVFDYRDSEQQALLLVSVFTYAFIILITAICIANIINTISTSIALRKREFAMLKSIGITPKGFNRMLNFESIFYGIKALVYGLPISVAVMYLMYRVLMVKFSYGFILPMSSIYIVIAAVFIIVGTAMLYSSKRVRKENIIDALKQEII